MISIIVPVYNGELFIERFFLSYNTMIGVKEVPHEVIVVDNNSTDGTRAILDKFESQLSKVKVVEYHAKQSSYAARNHGVRVCVGDVLAFTDIDCVLGESWLSTIASCRNELNNKIMSGPVCVFKSGELFNAYEWFDKCTFLKSEDNAKKSMGVTANAVLEAKTVKKYGFFKEFVSGADVEYFLRMKKAGVGFVYNERLEVGHPARSTDAEIKKKLKRVATGVAQRNGKRWLYFNVIKEVVAIVTQPYLVRSLMQGQVKNFEGPKWVFVLLLLKYNFYYRKCLLGRYMKSMLRLA